MLGVSYAEYDIDHLSAHLAMCKNNAISLIVANSFGPEQEWLEVAQVAFEWLFSTIWTLQAVPCPGLCWLCVVAADAMPTP